MSMHQKAESKDLLTEHLFTVIHQNELRKSAKLAELMRKLELEIGDDVDSSTSGTTHVPVCPTLLASQSFSYHPLPPSPPTTTMTSPMTSQPATVDVIAGGDNDTAKDRLRTDDVVVAAAVVSDAPSVTGTGLTENVDKTEPFASCTSNDKQ